MENKKYLDKVLGYVVKGTKMDYENKEVNTPFIYTLNSPPSSLPFLSPYFCSNRPPLPPLSFSSYCRNYFGLTKDEIRYIWKEYKNIINDKIENEG